MQARVAAVSGLRIDVRSERRQSVCPRRARLARRSSRDARGASATRRPDLEMSLRGNAAKLSASPSASRARDERVRAVVQHTRKPYANAIGGGVVGGQADRGSADRQRPGTDVKQMNDDVAARRGAPLVHYEPVEHVAMTRAGVSRPRAEPRHEQMGSDE